MSPTSTLRTAVLHFLVGTSESHTWIIHCRHQSTKASSTASMRAVRVLWSSSWSSWWPGLLQT